MEDESCMTAFHNLEDEENLLSEEEAARQLGVSIAHLHRLLDKHVFHGGHKRPVSCTFRSADLMLMRYWVNIEPEQKVVEMPRRK